MKYYCIGIKGSGMATLAEILYDLGNDVSGYDDYKEYKFTQEGIDKRGIKIYYDNEHEIDKDKVLMLQKMNQQLEKQTVTLSSQLFILDKDLKTLKEVLDSTIIKEK